MPQNLNTNNNNSLDQPESGSNPMLKWLSQGRSNSITQNSKILQRRISGSPLSINLPYGQMVKL